MSYSERTAWLFGLALLLCIIPGASAQPTALVGATVVNPGAAPTYEEATVIIEGERITAFGPVDEVTVPDGAEVIDVSGRWIIPGLVDGHVHFFQSGGLYTRPDAIDLRDRRPYEEELALIRDRLPDTFARYLRSGITSVVDVGGPMWNFEVREQAEDSERAPTIVAAGPLISSVQPDPLTTDDPPILRIDTPVEARHEVRRQVEAGTDLIKIWYIVRGGETPDAFRPVVDATIEEAHGAGKRVAVHATQLETARAAVEAGADILVHSVSDRAVDAEFIQLVVENNVLYTPTLMVSERYQRTFAQQLNLTPEEHTLAHPETIASLFDLRGMDPDDRPSRVRQLLESNVTVQPDGTALRNLTSLYRAGATIVAGTDAGNIGTPHGPALFYELRLMQAAGLAPYEILATATINGARLMGRSEDLGTVEEGKLADLLVLERDPRRDVINWSSIERVIKHGVVFSPNELAEDHPEDVAQRFVNALNDRNAQVLSRFVAQDVEVRGIAGAGEVTGRDALRAHLSSRFQQQPHHHIAVLDQSTEDGGMIIQREQIREDLEADPTERIVRYQVRDGRIIHIELEDG